MFRQATFYMAELFRQATFYLSELFRQATFYSAELFRQIAFLFKDNSVQGSSYLLCTCSFYEMNQANYQHTVQEAEI